MSDSIGDAVQAGAVSSPAGRWRAPAPDADEAAEGAVMGDEGVGDRADHPGIPNAETRVQNILEPDHVGLAVGAGLVAHAVIGGQRHHRAQRLQLGETGVDGGVEAPGLGLAGSEFVLKLGREPSATAPKPPTMKRAMVGMSPSRSPWRR